MHKVRTGRPVNSPDERFSNSKAHDHGEVKTSRAWTPCLSVTPCLPRGRDVSAGRWKNHSSRGGGGVCVEAASKTFQNTVVEVN